MAKKPTAGGGQPRYFGDDTGKELSRLSGLLFSRKRGWDSLCQELAENYHPMRSDFTTELQLGDDFALDLMDSYPVQARSQLGDAVESMLRQGKYFSPSSGDEELDKSPIVARSLDRMRQVVAGIMRNPRTKAQQQMKIADHDWVTFGANVLSWEESQERTHAVLKGHHLRDCAWVVNGDGIVDTIHRKLRMSALEVCRRADRDGPRKWKEPHPEIKRAKETDPGAVFNILHCLCPADDLYGSIDKAKLGKAKFVSVYYDADHEMTLHVAPQPWFNYIVSRWWVLGDCPWGFSPVAINTLADGRMAQALAGMVLEQGEKALDPPIVGAGDVFRNDVNLWSGGFSAVDLGDGRNLQDVMTVVDTAKNMPVGFEMKQDLRGMLAEGFLLNKLMLPNTREMTAFESGIRLDEFRRAALPFFSPIEAEYHSQVLSGGLEMAFQLRHLDPAEVPRELADREASWSFTSPLNEAEGQKIAASFRQVVADVASVLEIDPTAKTRVIWGEALNDALTGDGAKPKWLPTEEELAALTDQSKKMADASVAAGALQQGATVAADVSNSTMAARAAGLAPPQNVAA